MSDIFSLPFLKKSDLFTKTKNRMVIKPIVRLEILSQRRGPVAASYDAGYRRGPENDHGCPTWMYIY